jgi:hypothetical protein
MENMTTFLFKLDVKDRELLDASAYKLGKTRSSYLRYLIRNMAKQLDIDIKEFKESIKNNADKIDWEALADVE